MTFTSNKECLHPNFVLFSTEDILLVIFKAKGFLYTVAKVIKSCFKICKKSHFSKFLKYVKICLFYRNVLLMCVIYLMFSYFLI